MKIASALILLLVLVSCSATKTAPASEKPLYEILTQQNHGGAGIRFYEILSERKEINMLLGDEHLKNKIDVADITNANFLILNMGEKPSGGYSITIDAVVETADKILVTVKENEPDEGSMNTSDVNHPYTIVKINSKKPIEFK